MNARTRRSAWLGVGCLLFGLAALGCRAAEQGAEEDFLHIPMRERDTAILQYAPERQVDLYLKVMLEQHPPDLGLADAVATGGSKVVPALARRLVQDGREIAKLHLIDVFVRMQELGYYAIASDGETMDLLERQVAGMTDPQWKKISSGMLKSIREHK